MCGRGFGWKPRRLENAADVIGFDPKRRMFETRAVMWRETVMKLELNVKRTDEVCAFEIES
jgi:hypothetical protein